MNGSGLSWWRGVVVVALVISAPACRKPSDAVKSDLKQSGYQLTAEDWFRASRSNEVSALKKFVSSGFHPDTRDAAGDTALHAAASTGAKDSADFLLDRGMPVDVKGADDRTPLMSAVLAGESAMTAWLLKQGALPAAKDKEDFTALMLAVRADKPGCVAELAPYSRDQLDAAILLAALEGHAKVIDTLTNYGASVYARMEDGRTPLMVAAQNGHLEAVKLLLEIGSSRLSMDTSGFTASQLAVEAGHLEIAALLDRDPLPDEIALESPEDVAKSMDAFVQSALKENGAPETSSTAQTPSVPAVTSIEGETVSKIAANPKDSADSATRPPTANDARLPALAMRHYTERELPIQIRSVEGETATFEIMGAKHREIKIRTGETIPNTPLVVVRMHRRIEDSKLSLGQPVEISVVEVKDNRNGASREWIVGLPSSSRDPVALIEDAATGRRYTAVAGQRFKSEDGGEFLISEVRPNQIVIKDLASGAVSTLPLRGPRG